MVLIDYYINNFERKSKPYKKFACQMQHRYILYHKTTIHGTQKSIELINTISNEYYKRVMSALTPIDMNVRALPETSSRRGSANALTFSHLPDKSLL